ncbi:MAG: MBL fold metallo-hydrolase [Leptospirales bacterium]|nr:MBL fold metallo-hydrolase [Leptospirales bacterium]
MNITTIPNHAWYRVLTWARRIMLVLLILFVAILVAFYMSHKVHLKGVQLLWKERSQSRVPVSGSTNSLRILPLINWHASNDELQTEMGVSYLIQTDNQTILFDVGHNSRAEDPSPLIKNMERLGIRISDIDTIFISHLHFDHVGGKKWEKQNTFSLANKQMDLSGKNVFTPVPLTYPGLSPRAISQPTELFPGIVSLGPIARQLFMGRIDEQALAINVANKGIVLFSGCGHQTLPRILQRARESIGENIYGVVGDLHYPVPQGRLSLLGLNAQRVFASGDGPFETIEEGDIERDIGRLKNQNPGLVAIGGHDTSDEVIALFADEFGSAYHHVRVGEWIELR